MDLGDVDGDGFPDVITASGQHVAWQKNECAGTSTSLPSGPHHARAALAIAPNPASDHFVLTMDPMPALGHFVELVDLSGRVVRRLKPAGPSVVVERVGLGAGAYVVRLMSARGVVASERLVLY